MTVSVRGKCKSWGFHFYGDPKYIEEWREDGLDVVIVENTILWCFWQDVFHFKNPWRK